jgi:hypothetical protein
MWGCEDEAEGGVEARMKRDTDPYLSSLIDI